MSEGHPPGRRLDDGASSGCFPVDLYLLDAEFAGSLMALEENIHMVALDGAAGVLDNTGVPGLTGLVHGPVGELARVEGVFGEGEALRLLQLRSAQNGAHAGRLCVAAVQAHGLHADDVGAQLGCARLSFGPPEDMERLLGVTPGSATVLALQNDTAGDVALVIDRAVLQAPRFGCHPCINTSSLAFSTQDLTEKLLPALGHAPVLVDLPEDSDA